MLTEKNIHTTEYRQSDDAGTVAFSSTNYWSSSVSSYPADVYNNNSLLYPIVEEYVSYLNTKLTGATGSLLTYSQAEHLNCYIVGIYGCLDAPTWVSTTTYWTGSASDRYSLGYVESGGAFRYDDYDFDDFGGCPVITISTSDIQ